MDGQIELDANSDRLYELGMVVSHSSTGDGDADCGLSVGLGNGQMLYAGEMPSPLSWSLVIYSKTGSTLVAESIGREEGEDLIHAVAAAICSQSPTA